MIRISLLLLLLFILGWVAWPAFSGYQIYGGLKAADESVLERKINWDSLRASLRPVVAKQVETQLGKLSGGGGAAGAFGTQLQQQLAPQIVDVAMQTIVTPKGLIEVMKHGGDVSRTINEVVSRNAGGAGGGGVLGGLLGNKPGQGGGLGGLLGELAKNDQVRDLAGGVLGKAKDAASQPAAPAQSESAGPSYSLANLKRFAYTGLTSLEVGVAKDPAATVPDVTAVMEFQGFDWKLTGLLPRVQ
jgi:hypothetical protein